jgi:polyisoprenoid-binding protein YceI
MPKFCSASPLTFAYEYQVSLEGEFILKAFLSSVLFLILGVTYLSAAEKQIDPEQSTLTIHVGKTGLLSAAGHEHTVRAPIAEGTVDDGASAHVSFRVEAARLVVLPEDRQSEIQHSMQERVLDSSHFPEISFVSNEVQSIGDGKWDVSGDLTLHGETRPVEVRVQYRGDTFVGSATIKQTDFGIQPISAAGGTVKVKNELKVDFTIRTK